MADQDNGVPGPKPEKDESVPNPFAVARRPAPSFRGVPKEVVDAHGCPQAFPILEVPNGNGRPSQ